MAHFAFICVPTTGHIDPMANLARELADRGHRATFLHHPDVGPIIERRSLDFHPVGVGAGPPGALGEALDVASQVKGPLAIRPLIATFARGSAMFCEALPEALRALSVDAIVSDWLEPASGLVARHMGLPYVSVCNALPLNWEPGVPSPFVGWGYGDTRWHRARDAAVQHVAQMMQRPLHDVIRTYSARWGLGPDWSVQQMASGYAQVAQLTRSLDYPRRALIGCFHYCGPFRAASPPAGPRRRTGRAFASLGSLQGHRVEVFERIVEATAALGLQLTIAHGGRLAPRDVARLSRRAAVRDFVSYDEILRDVDVAILHGGMNGTLDALAHGVPLVTIPLAYEQGAIAARTRYAGVGTVCRPPALRRHLVGAIRAVLETPSYAEAAGRLRDEIAAAGGVRRAADIVEQVARTGQPCLNAEAVAASSETAAYALGADRLG